MKLSIINEILNIKKIMGVLNEDIELSSESSDLSKVQSLLDLEDIEIKAKDVLDDSEPICSPPKKLNEEENKLISDFWDLVVGNKNKTTLKHIFTKIKNILYDDENIEEGIIIGGLYIPRNQIINLGETLIVITILGLIRKNTDCSEQNKRS